jgi:hypothetical protein
LVCERRFELSAATLTAAARAFRLPEAHSGEQTDVRRDYAVFAIRGARAHALEMASHTSPADSFTIEPMRPDFTRLSCVFGLWRPDGRLSLFRGSTLPNHNNVVDQAGHTDLPVEKQSSAIATGCYLYPVDSHHKPHEDLYLPRVLRAPAGYWSLRPNGRPAFGMNAHWVKGSAHNIHPARGGAVYSSQGCLVIEGTDIKQGQGRKRTGAWKAFFETLDLDSNKMRHPFYLFTGDELSYVQHFSPAFAGLRFGSSGGEVQALECLGGLAVDRGIFGYGVQRYVIESLGNHVRTPLGAATPRQNFHATIWADELSRLGILPGAAHTCPPDR